MYAFLDDKFFRGVYLFTSKYNDGKEYIRDYGYLKSLLSMKYGEPAQDDKKWISETWKKFPDKYSHALYMGDVSYITMWTTDTTSVELSMGEENGKVSIKILYSSISLSEDHTARILEDL